MFIYRSGLFLRRSIIGRSYLSRDKGTYSPNPMENCWETHKNHILRAHGQESFLTARFCNSTGSFSSVGVYEHHCLQNQPNQLETKRKPMGNTKNLPKPCFLMTEISGLIPCWKLMGNCQMVDPHQFPEENQARNHCNQKVICWSAFVIFHWLWLSFDLFWPVLMAVTFVDSNR